MAIDVEVASAHDLRPHDADRAQIAEPTSAEAHTTPRAAHIPGRCLTRRVVLPHEIGMTVDVEVLGIKSRGQHERAEGQIERPTWKVAVTNPSWGIRQRIEEQIPSRVRVSG